MKPGLLSILTVAAALSAAPVASQGEISRGIDIVQSQRVASALETGVAACFALPEAYLADCVGKAFRQAVRQIGNNADYWEAEVALTRVSRNTERMVLALKDESADRLRHEGNRLRAVTQIAGAMAFVRQSVEDAATDMARLSQREQQMFEPISDVLASVSRRLAGGGPS